MMDRKWGYRFRKPRPWWSTEAETILENKRVFWDYLYRLENIAVSMFHWEGLPDSVDERFLELILCEYGYAIYFNDEILGNLALTCMIGGPLDVYRIPIYRRAYANSGYQKDLSEKDSVMIFNNYMHTPTLDTLFLFAQRLTNLERSIQVNVNAQKTPILLVCDESQKLTLEKVYNKYMGNMPVIYGAKNLDVSNFQSLTTNAPFVADDLNQLKRQIWGEAMTFLGVANSDSDKRERLVSSESTGQFGNVEAQRHVGLASRRAAAEKINKMFGTNITVEYRQNFTELNFGGEEDGEIYNDNRRNDGIGDEDRS